MRIVTRLYAALAAGALIVACVPSTVATARARAANEFDCPEDQIRVVRHPELSPDTVMVYGCGHGARYTCPSDARNFERWCVREK